MSKTKYTEAWDSFINLCLETKDPKLLSQMLDVFFTFEEKENLAMRYLIVEELIKAEKPQRQIAKELNVSIAKITRGSNELKRMNAKLSRYLQERFSK